MDEPGGATPPALPAKTSRRRRIRRWVFCGLAIVVILLATTVRVSRGQPGVRADYQVGDCSSYRDIDAHPLALRKVACADSAAVLQMALRVNAGAACPAGDYLVERQIDEQTGQEHFRFCAVLYVRPQECLVRGASYGWRPIDCPGTGPGRFQVTDVFTGADSGRECSATQHLYAYTFTYAQPPSRVCLTILPPQPVSTTPKPI